MAEQKFMYETLRSHLMAYKGKLFVMKRDNSGYADGAISVLPGFQIELGRPVSDFIDAIQYTRLPVFFKLLKEKGNIALYTIVRMKTDAVDETLLGSVRCVDGVMQAFGFHRGLLENDNFMRYCKPEPLCSLSAPAEKGVSGVIHCLKPLLPADHMLTAEQPDARSIRLKVSTPEVMLVYDFVFDERENVFVLVSISLPAVHHN